MSAPFDDFLRLAPRRLDRERLLVFTGASGSGKSTAIAWLLAAHPDFRRREALVLRRDAGWPPATGAVDVLVLDDLVDRRDLAAAVRLARSARTVVLASHLAPLAIRARFPLARACFFYTDRDEAKIARSLAARGVEASPRSIRAFVSRFGATYTDLDIILERYPACDFDRALGSFLHWCAVEVMTPEARSSAYEV